MAIITSKFDTMSKSLVVDMDGTVLENVKSFSVYPCYDDPTEFCCEVMQKQEDEASDVTIWTRLSASLAKQKSKVEKLIKRVF